MTTTAVLLRLFPILCQVEIYTEQLNRCRTETGQNSGKQKRNFCSARQYECYATSIQSTAPITLRTSAYKRHIHFRECHSSSPPLEYNKNEKKCQKRITPPQFLLLSHNPCFSASPVFSPCLPSSQFAFSWCQMVLNNVHIIQLHYLHEPRLILNMLLVGQDEKKTALCALPVVFFRFNSTVCNLQQQFTANFPCVIFIHSIFEHNKPLISDHQKAAICVTMTVPSSLLHKLF